MSPVAIPVLGRPYPTAWLLLVVAVAVVVGVVGFRGESEVLDGARPGG